MAVHLHNQGLSDVTFYLDGQRQPVAVVRGGDGGQSVSITTTTPAPKRVLAVVDGHRLVLDPTREPRKATTDTQTGMHYELLAGEDASGQWHVTVSSHRAPQGTNVLLVNRVGLPDCVAVFTLGKQKNTVEVPGGGSAFVAGDSFAMPVQVTVRWTANRQPVQAQLAMLGWDSVSSAPVFVGAGMPPTALPTRLTLQGLHDNPGGREIVVMGTGAASVATSLRPTVSVVMRNQVQQRNWSVGQGAWEVVPDAPVAVFEWVHGRNQVALTTQKVLPGQVATLTVPGDAQVRVSVQVPHPLSGQSVPPLTSGWMDVDVGQRTQPPPLVLSRDLLSFRVVPHAEKEYYDPMTGQAATSVIVQGSGYLTPAALAAPPPNTFPVVFSCGVDEGVVQVEAVQAEAIVPTARDPAGLSVFHVSATQPHTFAAYADTVFTITKGGTTPATTSNTLNGTQFIKVGNSPDVLAAVLKSGTTTNANTVKTVVIVFAVLLAALGLVYAFMRHKPS